MICNQKDITNSFKEGFEFWERQMGANVGGESAHLTNGKYLSSIQEEINNLLHAINGYSGNGNPNLKGFVAEAWHTYTFNIDAAAKQTGEKAVQLGSNELGSVDISTNWGGNYSLKYYKTGEKSALAQGNSLESAYQRFINNQKKLGNPIISKEEYLNQNGIDPKTDMSLGMYAGQARLIPSDQIKDAIQALKDKINKEANNLNNPEREKIAERLREVMDKLTSHIESPQGASSLNLTEADSRVLAQLAKEGKFDPKRFNITLAKKADYALLCENVFKAGLNAAWISALLKMVPDIINSLKELLKEGKIDEDDLINITKEGTSGAASGFIRGILCASITTASEVGILGEALKDLSQSANFAPAVGTIVVLVSQAISDFIRFNKNDLSKEELAINIERNIYIAAGSILGGCTLQSIVCIPIISYGIGSLIGSLLGGLVFNAKENIFITLCVNNGWTVFGLVEQDYSMPDELRERLGFPYFGIEKYPWKEYQWKEYSWKEYSWKEYQWKKIDCTLLKRGVIGCRKIGYIE